jgi:anti-sigma regulatory factor (Ser/Thr protein kinase)
VVVQERLPKQPTSPARARRILQCFDGRLPPQRLDDARLLLSEVVTNAVEHVDADGDIELVLWMHEDCLRVEVLDPGDGFQLRERDPHGDRGWGLQFVDRLSDRWGVAAGRGGRVWFELAA